MNKIFIQLMKFCFPFSRFQIEGTSMLPLYQPGDRVLVFRCGTVKEGNTVVFYKNGMIMVKRAVKKQGERWLMRGENFSQSTDSEDFGTVEENSFIGKVLMKY